MSLVRGTFRRTLRGKSHRKTHRRTEVSAADLAASLFPTPRPALVPIPVRASHRGRRHRHPGYAAGRGGRRIFRVT